MRPMYMDKEWKVLNIEGRTGKAAACRPLGERPNLVGGHILCVFKCCFEGLPLDHRALLPPSGQSLASSQFWLCCDREMQYWDWKYCSFWVWEVPLTKVLWVSLEKTPLRMGQHSCAQNAEGKPCEDSQPIGWSECPSLPCVPSPPCIWSVL